MGQCKKHPPDEYSPAIAVTGASGFIGGFICRHLLNTGFRVRCLVRSPDKARTLKEQAREAGTEMALEIVKGDLFDRAALARLLDGVTAVVHCAGAVRGASQEQFDQVNVEGIRQLLQSLKHSTTATRIISLSSLAARRPELSFYANSKYRGEKVLSSETNMSWMILRPPAVYGPGDKELLPLFRVMAKGLAPVPGSLNARFSMLYVGDLAAAVEAWLRCETALNGIYTLDDGHSGGYTWPDVSGLIAQVCQRPVKTLRVPAWMLDFPAHINRSAAKILGYAPMLTPEKLRELRHEDWVCDNKALCGVIDWQPQVSLIEGLRKTPGWPGYEHEDNAHKRQRH